MRVAMAFPELEDEPSNTLYLDAFKGEDVDFVLFPEGYIDTSQERCFLELRDLASDVGAPLLVGATDSEHREILLRFDPDGSDPARLYTKHSSAGRVAFQESDWNPRDMLPTFDVSGVRAGATLCSDNYLGLLQRRLAKDNALIWLNPCFDNMVDVKWSSVLRLRAVESRFFALCTLHDNVEKRNKTHPFAFSPDGHELHARKAGSAEKRPISECKEAGTVYIVELDVARAGKPLDWSKLPRAAKPPRPRSGKPKKPVRVSMRNGRPAVCSKTGWIGDLDGRIRTEHGGVYVGVVRNGSILDASECFGVIDRARQLGCRPIIWNHWDRRLPTESDRLAVLMMGRAIECSAQIVISDHTGIQELVELVSNSKFPVRRIVDSSKAEVDVEYALGMDSAFRMVAGCIHTDCDQAEALKRYRSLA